MKRAVLAFVVMGCSAFGCDRGALVLLSGGTGSDASDRGSDASPTSSTRDASFGGATGFPDRSFECTSALQCARGMACDPRTHRCVECLFQSQCPRPAYCDTVVGRCVLTCRSGSDCVGPLLMVCNQSRRVCVQCVYDSECASPTPFCESATGQCVECIEDANCRFLPWCSAKHQCVECLYNSSCGSGRVCSNGTCVAQ